MCDYVYAFCAFVVAMRGYYDDVTYISLKVHGRGTLTYVGGDKYVSEWVDAKKHGDGELIYTNGDRFKGTRNIIIKLMKDADISVAKCFANIYI